MIKKQLYRNESPKVLHVLHHSEPQMSGYAIRSKYVLKHLKILGVDIRAVTSDFQINGSGSQFEFFDDVKVYRTLTRKLKLKNKVFKRISYLIPFTFTARLNQLIREIRPDIVHVHTPFYCMMPFFLLSRLYHFKIVYEVRGLWEETAVANGRIEQGGLIYKLIRYLENLAFMSADHIVTISEGLKKELSNRNISPELITVVPNSVDSCFVSEIGESTKKVEVSDELVLGYIGSVTMIEGLEYLIRAVDILRDKKIKVVIVGEGNALEGLRALALDLGLKERITFVGKVEHTAVSMYYKMIDIFVLPRTMNRVNEIVTPLKPLEIMANGGLVLCSNVGGLKEIVCDGSNGLLFDAENPVDLAEKISQCYCNRALVKKIGENAQEWVVKNRIWSNQCSKYLYLYDNLMASECNEE